MRQTKSLLFILLAIMLITPVIPIAFAMTEFVDNYQNESYIAIKDNMVRNSTYDAMELNYTMGVSVLSAPLQVREHDRSAYYPIMVYSLQATYLYVTSGTTSLGYSWWFFSVDRDWINDKYLRWRWAHSGYSQAHLQIYDGEYNRSSMVDFPNNAGILLKGNGFLGTLDTVSGTTETSDFQIDVSGGSEEKVTIFFLLSDSWTAQSMTLRLYWFEINEESGGSGPIMSWDMSTAGTTLTMEQTGTYNDYGRVDGGDIEDVYTGGYESEGFFYTTEVLNGISGSSQVLLTNSTLNGGTLSVAFSSDNETWVDHNNETGYDSLLGGFESFDLRDLDFTTMYMRYNFTRGGVDLTPRLYQIRLITIPDDVVDNYENEDYVAIKDDMIRNSTYNDMELNYSEAIVRIKLYQNSTASASFQYREHRIWGGTGYTWSAQGYTANDWREGITPSIYKIACWSFITVDREWLDGKYVRFRWYKWGIGFSGGNAYTFPMFRIYDGEYNRSSMTDFPIGSQPLEKGSGGLMYSKHRGGSDVNFWYLEDVLVDVSSGNQSYCTLMWGNYDYSTLGKFGLIIDYIQINTASGGSGNLWTTDFESAVHNIFFEIGAPLGGTWDDYGLHNQTEGYSSGGYQADGFFYTSEFLDGISGTTLDLLTNSTMTEYEIITVEFSLDNATWVDHNNVSGYDTLVTGYDAIDLRDFNGTTVYMRFNFTRGADILSTPRLYQIRLLYDGAVVVVNIPVITTIVFNTTVGGEGCSVLGIFTDVEGLSGYIFWNNASAAPGGTNSSFTSLTGTLDSALENITLPSGGTKVSVRYFVNDTGNNWAIYLVIISELNNTVAGEGCGITGDFTDSDGLSGYIFWNNATSPPGGVNSSFTSLGGTSDSALENITLPSSGTRVGLRYYLNDTTDDWMITSVVAFPTADPVPNLPAVDEIEFNTTIAGEVCGISGDFSDVEGLSGYIFWENATNPPGGVNSSFTALAGVSDSALEDIALPSADTKVGVKYYVNDTDNNWAVDTLIIFPSGESIGVGVRRRGGDTLIIVSILLAAVVIGMKKIW